MPTLEKEIDMYPDDLLDIAAEQTLNTYGDPMNCELACWWAIYTRSRHEKQLMRKLLSLDVPFYGPVVERRYRSAAGRVRTSYETLFSNYVFVFGTADQRYQAMTTNCVSRCCAVVDGQRLTSDLQNLYRLISTGAPLTPESRVLPGDRVRVRTGPFAGFEGLVLKRHGETRLLVYVEFMRQGASVLLEDCQLDVL
jgi:transcription antitermination factor NusG